VSFLRYQGEEPDVGKPPPRVYARLDHVARVAEDAASPFAGDEVALLDSVDANWFDGAQPERKSSLADRDTVEEADLNVSILEVRTRDLQGALGTLGSLPDTMWIEVNLQSEHAVGASVLHYMNLFAAPIDRTLRHARWVGPALDRELADKTSMNDLLDSERDELDVILGSVRAPEALAVYDVGQGNCSAALDGQAPTLYFDFGGGALGNRRTFPAALTEFCFTNSPPVVLSHWDWDHWSSANRDSRAYAQTWIVPRQGINGLGPVHRTFLARLLQNGVVRVWPTGLPSLRVGEYELLRCCGPASSRNDSGLALVVSRTIGGTSRRMLLPGDCGYGHVPTADTGRFTSLVASHHGGRTGTSVMPQPDGTRSGRLVYSYGQGNSYGHPFASVREDHMNAGWRTALETSARCSSRSALPTAPALGHVHLYWDPGVDDANPGCGGRQCQLACHQR
jgi:hypothetical protein